MHAAMADEDIPPLDEEADDAMEDTPPDDEVLAEDNAPDDDELLLDEELLEEENPEMLPLDVELLEVSPYWQRAGVLSALHVPLRASQ